MSTPVTDQLRAYFDDVDRQQGAVDLDALRRSVEEGVIMIELSDKAVSPTQPTSGRRWPILAAAAAVLLVGVLVVYEGDRVTPADEPSPTVTVPPTQPPQPLPTYGQGDLEPGTYYLDKVNGTPTPRIFVTVGAGWRYSDSTSQLWRMEYHPPSGPRGDYGVMTIGRAVAVFADACHPSGGYHPGPVTTLDDLVAALTEQQGWAEVTAPSDISIDGYAGKAFQRTAPTDMTDCDSKPLIHNQVRDWRVYRDGAGGHLATFRSWEPGGDFGGDLYEPGQIETLWVVDLDGTVVVIAQELWPTPAAPSHPDFAADVLDSIRIERA